MSGSSSFNPTGLAILIVVLAAVAIIYMINRRR
jgi:hypothetical protein